MDKCVLHQRDSLASAILSRSHGVIAFYLSLVLVDDGGPRSNPYHVLDTNPIQCRGKGTFILCCCYSVYFTIVCFACLPGGADRAALCDTPRRSGIAASKDTLRARAAASLPCTKIQ